jgi:DNA-binding CsgD family transcriptional regulator
MNDKRIPARRANRASAQRDARALDLRVRGATYTQIATLLGLRVSSVYTAVERALARSATAIDVEHYRELELERLDTLLRACWPQATAETPNWDAVNAVLKISLHRMRLLGLNREPMVDFEAEIRRAARVAGEDEDEAVREAQALLRGVEGRRVRRGLTLISGD